MESGDEDELTTGSRDFVKMQEKLFKAGYVEGATMAEEKAQETFYPHQTTLIRAYMELGKLMGVVQAAISTRPEIEEEESLLHPFLAKLQSYALHLHLLSNPDQQQQEQPSSSTIEADVGSFIEEFKTLMDPESAALIHSLFFNDNEEDEEEACKDNQGHATHSSSSGGGGDCGDSNCKCINGISVDLNKLSF